MKIKQFIFLLLCVPSLMFSAETYLAKVLIAYVPTEDVDFCDWDDKLDDLVDGGEVKVNAEFVIQRYQESRIEVESDRESIFASLYFDKVKRGKVYLQLETTYHYCGDEEISVSFEDECKLGLGDEKTLVVSYTGDGMIIARIKLQKMR